MEFEISLRNLRFYAYHGVFEEERRLGNEFIVNLSVKVLYKEDILEDALSSTISYADLYALLADEMSKPRNLLEKVLAEIVLEIKNRFPEVKSGRVCIEKVRPPIPEMLGSAEVCLAF